MTDAAPIFTIGHSNHALAEFLALLDKHGVTAVADVRSHPFSRRNPHFNREELEPALRQLGTVYVFLGDQLGGRPGQPSLYDDGGRIDYDRVRKTEFFERGLDRLDKARQKFTVALMCSEEDPLDCHRGLMIAPALKERDVLSNHIRASGAVETTAEMEQRLLDETRIGVGLLDGLFADTLADADRRDLLAEAYRVMSRKKAFRLKPGQTPSAALDVTEE
jgi:uncharacterized protein (DUF488 family)